MGLLTTCTERKNRPVGRLTASERARTMLWAC